MSNLTHPSPVSGGSNASSSFSFERDLMVTHCPEPECPPCGATRFRWRTHIALPFMLPTKHDVMEQFESDGFQFTCTIHNQMDRLLRGGTKSSPQPLAMLVPKLTGNKARSQVAGGMEYRQPLQSVAEFVETTEYGTPKEAFRGAQKKIATCFVLLSGYLTAIQRSLPYMASWVVYPLSLYDVGMVYHSVDHFCPTKSDWVILASSFCASIGRQLRLPFFEADLKKVAYPPDLDLANELLAEAHVSLFRSIPRLAVLNSFTAVETLANSVFGRLRSAQLVKYGVPEKDAEEIADGERRANRTDERYLLNTGLQKMVGRSLAIENKALYDEILKLEKQIRHTVAHKGIRPTMDEARNCHRVCCEVVRWLSEVAGYPNKPLVPAGQPSMSFAAGSELHMSSSVEISAIRALLTGDHGAQADGATLIVE
jgi:hypothetical protein